MSRIRISISTPLLPAALTFVRVLHEDELPSNRRSTPAKMPEVRPLFPNHFSVFGEPWQSLAWEMNPLLRAVNMTAVYHNNLWVANRHGFGDIPRRNYFENTNLDSSEDLAVEALTCGGNVLHVLGEMKAKTNDGIVDCYIIETLDRDNPPPTWEWLKKHPWLVTEATKLDSEGQVTRFPQGYNHLGYAPGVRHPLVGNPSQYSIVIEKWRVVKWLEPNPPDPYKIYITVCASGWRV